MKKCRRCTTLLPLGKFEKRPQGGQGVSGLCHECLEHRYEHETFTCSRCGDTKIGTSFFRGSQGSVVVQPCRDCLSSIKKTKTRMAQIEKGRSPYHLLSSIDSDTRQGVCRECGPVHLYATGTRNGCGWRCGVKADLLSAAWYDTKAEVSDKHAAKRWHRIRNVRNVEMIGECTQCGDTPVRWNQSSGFFTCDSPDRKRAHAATERRRKRLKIYGLSEDDYERMNEQQQGLCAICGGTRVRAGTTGLVVDHDHETGAVRGLLCSSCNTGIGHMQESKSVLMAAIRYLEYHGSLK